MNPTQLQALKTLIAATPATAGQPLQTIADILNTPADSKVNVPDVPRRTVLRILAGRGIISKIYDGARNSANTHQLRSICFAVEYILTAGAEGLDTADAGNTAMMGALRTAGIVSQADIDALNATALKRGTPAESVGLPPPSAGDVDDALKLV